MNNRIFVDIDKTICFTNGMSYENAVPNPKNIKKSITYMMKDI